jgi:enoyl-CoA hydratase/carnithine racemase
MFVRRPEWTRASTRSRADHGGTLMTNKDEARLQVEGNGSVLLVRVDGGEHGLFGLDLAIQLDELVDRADKDPGIHAVVFTGARSDRFVSHADVRWLQEGGAEVPAIGRRGAAAIIDTSHNISKARPLDSIARKAPLWSGVQVDRLHETFLKMNRSGVIYVAAINGSTLGLGAEFAWACDLRVWLTAITLLVSQRYSSASCRAVAVRSVLRV